MWKQLFCQRWWTFRPRSRGSRWLCFGRWMLRRPRGEETLIFASNECWLSTRFTKSCLFKWNNWRSKCTSIGGICGVSRTVQVQSIFSQWKLMSTGCANWFVDVLSVIALVNLHQVEEIIIICTAIDNNRQCLANIRLRQKWFSQIFETNCRLSCSCHRRGLLET